MVCLDEGVSLFLLVVDLCFGSSPIKFTFGFEFFVVIALMIVVSFFTTAADPSKIQGLYLGSATAEQRALTRASWSKWDVVHSAIIIAVIIAFYIYFW